MKFENYLRQSLRKFVGRSWNEILEKNWKKVNRNLKKFEEHIQLEGI